MIIDYAILLCYKARHLQPAELLLVQSLCLIPIRPVHLDGCRVDDISGAKILIW
jgi:hypothetical protein